MTTRARGVTRSGFSRDLAHEHLAEDDEAQRSRIDRLLASPERFHGHGTRHVRESRRSR